MSGSASRSHAHPTQATRYRTPSGPCGRCPRIARRGSGRSASAAELHIFKGPFDWSKGPSDWILRTPCGAGRRVFGDRVRRQVATANQRVEDECKQKECYRRGMATRVRTWRFTVFGLRICGSGARISSGAPLRQYGIDGHSHRLVGRYRHATSAGRTRLAISAPCSRLITAISYWLCRSSQNCARFPK